MEVEASLTPTTPAMSIDSTTVAATTTAATTTTPSTSTASNISQTTSTTASTTAAATTTTEVSTTASTTAAATATTEVSTTTAATTTSATTTAATTASATSASATTTTVTVYVCCMDISTIASVPSPASTSSATLLQLSREFFSNRSVRLLQEAVEIGAWECSPQSHTNFLNKLHDLFGNINDGANTQVTRLLNFAEGDVDCKLLKYNRYSIFLEALNTSSSVMAMIKLHHSAQQRETWAMKMLGDLWQDYPELQEILSDSSASDMRLR